MNISSVIIKTALQEYDNQAGKTSYLRASLFGEYEGVASLRRLSSTLPDLAHNLTQQELFTFITILINAVPVGNKRHDELFTKLRTLVGEDKFKAFAQLKTKDALKENIERVAVHDNPQSAARMITHFVKHQKELSNKESIDNLLFHTDPYFSLKTVTSTASALRYLKNANLNSESNKQVAQQKPIPIAKALKQLIINNIIVSNEIFTMVEQHQTPVKMALAVVDLYMITDIKDNKKLVENILDQAKNHSDPESFVKGVIYLHKMTINTNDNRNIIAQSDYPFLSAKLLGSKNIKDSLQSMNSITYGITRGVFFMGGGFIRDPISLIETNETKIKEAMTKPNL
jgi:hypothetical protein